MSVERFCPQFSISNTPKTFIQEYSPKIMKKNFNNGDFLEKKICENFSNLSTLQKKYF